MSIKIKKDFSKTNLSFDSSNLFVLRKLPSTCKINGSKFLKIDFFTATIAVLLVVVEKFSSSVKCQVLLVFYLHH